MLALRDQTTDRVVVARPLGELTQRHAREVRSDRLSGAASFLEGRDLRHDAFVHEGEEVAIALR